LHALVSTVYTVVGNFKSLIILLGICDSLFYLLTACSLFVLRVREPTLERPYRTFLGWPLIFSSATIFILLMPIVAAPLEALVAAGVILSGIPAYYLLRKRTKLCASTASHEIPI
jgi:amino acid transporter